MSDPMSAAAVAPTRHTHRPDRIEIGGLAVVTTAAVVLSFSALAGLGLLVGFGSVSIFGLADFPLSLLVPLCIDAYGATAARIAVNRTYSEATRGQAMIHGIVAIGVGILGNAAYHLIEGKVVVLGDAKWVLVIAVSIVPPVALGALVHLMSLCAADRRAAQERGPDPVLQPVPETVDVQVHVPRLVPEAPRQIEPSPEGEQAMRAIEAFAKDAAGVSARVLHPQVPAAAAAPTTAPAEVRAPEAVPAQASAPETPDAAARRLLDQLALHLDEPGPNPAPGTAQVRVPVPVPPPTELHLKAVQTFAPDGRLERVPPLRVIKEELNVGQPKASQVQKYLTELVAS